MRLIYFVFLSLAVVGVLAAPTKVTIRQWPHLANVLFTWNWSIFERYCSGTVLSDRNVLTAAHCVVSHPVSRFRLRLGSTFVNSGGVAVNVENTLIHPYYNSKIEDYDIAILRSNAAFAINDQVQPARIASFNYIVADNQLLYSPGWSTDEYDKNTSEELALEQIWSINQLDCARRYSTENVAITDNMLCAGSLSLGGRDQCRNDFGSPLFHEGTLVGIYSFSINCGKRFFPGVNVRVSRVSDWIQANNRTSS